MGYLRSDVPFIRCREESLIMDSTDIIAADIYIIVYKPPDSSTTSEVSRPEDPTNLVPWRVREDSFPQGSWFRRYSDTSSRKYDVSIDVSQSLLSFPFNPALRQSRVYTASIRG